MSLSLDTLKESKSKAVKNFKGNSKGPSSKVHHSQQQLTPDAYGKTCSRTNACFYRKLSQWRAAQGLSEPKITFLHLMTLNLFFLQVVQMLFEHTQAFNPLPVFYIFWKKYSPVRHVTLKFDTRKIIISCCSEKKKFAFTWRISLFYWKIPSFPRSSSHC